MWFLIKQSSIENATLAEEQRRFGGKESLSKIVALEDPKDP
ncbi:MAG: hypothetical protein ACI9KM_002700 [Rubritalea sp.]